ncbi:MAG TPA: hypothetical protein VFQ04_01245, partial [Actinomycetes bacterium]|nr:hypothetical protein [Actinomycetes bacterium]
MVRVAPQEGRGGNSFKWFGRDLGGNFVSGYVVRGLTDRITGFWPELTEPVDTGQVNRWVEAVRAPVVQPVPVRVDLAAANVTVVPDRRPRDRVPEPVPVLVEEPVVPGVEDLLAAARRVASAFWLSGQRPSVAEVGAAVDAFVAAAGQLVQAEAEAEVEAGEDGDGDGDGAVVRAAVAEWVSLMRADLALAELWDGEDPIRGAQVRPLLAAYRVGLGLLEKKSRLDQFGPLFQVSLAGLTARSARLLALTDRMHEDLAEQVEAQVALLDSDAAMADLANQPRRPSQQRSARAAELARQHRELRTRVVMRRLNVLSTYGPKLAGWGYLTQDRFAAAVTELRGLSQGLTDTTAATVRVHALALLEVRTDVAGRVAGAVTEDVLKNMLAKIRKNGLPLLKGALDLVEFAERVAEVVALAGTSNTELATVLRQRGEVLNLEALLAAPQPPTGQDVQHALTVLAGPGMALLLANKLPLKDFHEIAARLASRLDQIAEDTTRTAVQDRISLLRLEADLRQHPMDTDEVAEDILTRLRDLLSRTTTTAAGGGVSFGDLEQRVNAGYDRYHNRKGKAKAKGSLERVVRESKLLLSEAEYRAATTAGTLTLELARKRVEVLATHGARLWYHDPQAAPRLTQDFDEVRRAVQRTWPDLAHSRDLGVIFAAGLLEATAKRMGGITEPMSRQQKNEVIQARRNALVGHGFKLVLVDELTAQSLARQARDLQAAAKKVDPKDGTIDAYVDLLLSDAAWYGNPSTFPERLAALWTFASRVADGPDLLILLTHAQSVGSLTDIPVP